MIMMMISTSVLIFSSLAYLANELFSLKHSIKERIAIQAEMVANNANAAILFNDMKVAEEILNSLKADEHVVSAHIFDNNRKVLAEYQRRNPIDRHFVSLDIGIIDLIPLGQVYVEKPVILTGERLGSVAVYATTSELALRIVRYLTIAVAILVLSIFVALLMSTSLTQLVSAPIIHLATVARQVAAEGNYKVRVKASSNDELGALADDFNTMLDRIEQRDVELESLVKHRTDELINLNEKLRHQAYHDPLTGLPNRALFDDRLSQAIVHGSRRNKQFAICYLDLDRFKTINDTLGHDVGDELLKKVSDRLEECVRKEDAVARLGGDEFTILINNLRNPEDAAVCTNTIAQRLKEPVVLAGRKLSLTASIGIAVFPEDGKDIVTLKKNADTAMYHAKELGRDKVEFFSDQLNNKVRQRLLLETELARAIDEEQLVIHFQPQFNIKQHRLVGFEALVRWNHPEKGLIYPVDFIPFAEENGLVSAIDRWVLQTACSKFASLAKHSTQPLKLAVNIAADDLHKLDLPTVVTEVLQQNDIKPENLELEITEGSIMKNTDASLKILQTIRDLGVGLALDDFGTGYSSLRYLKLFPFGAIKIDRSFVRDIASDSEDANIVRVIISMARHLNLDVIAEGVETIHQLKLLDSMNCHNVQGYYLSKPLAEKDIHSSLESTALKSLLTA